MSLAITIFLLAAGTALLWLGVPPVAGFDSVPLGVLVLLIGVVAGFVSLMFWSASGELGWRRERRAAPARRRRRLSLSRRGR